MDVVKTIGTRATSIKSAADVRTRQHKFKVCGLRILMCKEKGGPSLPVGALGG